MKTTKLAPVKYPLNDLERAVGAALALIDVLSENSIQHCSEPGLRMESTKAGYVAAGIASLADSVSDQLLAALNATFEYVKVAKPTAQ